jgi:two-component system response regulator (stage 0 sporulation protein F)
MKILLVEDNEILAYFIKKMLEDEGYEVISAGDGIDGYLSYLTFKPDLILTDIQMPKENGLELMKQVRVHNPMIKTVYMSANLYEYLPVLEEERKRFPVSLLEKPFSRMELMRVLSE